MIVVDLDGTLVDCNSFTEFVKFLFRRIPSLRMPLIKAVISRKLRMISHHTAKEKIVSMAVDLLSTINMDDFVEFLCKKINPKIREIIENCEDEILLATAAPEIYVAPFALKAGISKFITTVLGKPENKGIQKLNNITNSGIVFDENTIVITDHRDDLPLLKANSHGHNYIVNPSRRSLKTLRREGIRFEII